MKEHQGYDVVDRSLYDQVAFEDALGQFVYFLEMLFEFRKIFALRSFSSPFFFAIATIPQFARRPQRRLFVGHFLALHLFDLIGEMREIARAHQRRVDDQIGRAARFHGALESVGAPFL